MPHRIVSNHLLAAALLCVMSLPACSGSDNNGPSSSSSGTGASGTGGDTSTGGSGATISTGGSGGTISTGGTGGTTSTGGAGGAGGGLGGSGGAGPCTLPSDCDDDIDCTVDDCDAGECTHTVDDGACDNGTFCDGVETCDPPSGDAQTGCVAGSDPCDDGLDCTIDSCDEAGDSCGSVPDDGACDNGTFCDGAEYCDLVLGCQAGADPCDDVVGCTVDSCDEGADSCSNQTDDGACDNGAFCDGVETCDAQNDCVAGTSPCDDGIACTLNGCEEGSDTCVYTPSNAACSDGIFCDGAEVCDPPNGDPQSGCREAAAPACEDGIDCTTDTCDEQNDLCDNVADDGYCDDGLFCTGTEFCNINTGQCESSGATDCSDSYSCTSDFCDTQTDSCANVAVNANCSNGQFCDGPEVCDPGNGDADGCRAGTPPNCDDSVDCTDNGCDEQNDVCVYTPDHAACDDTDFCNGAEICLGGVGCTAGQPPSCSDGLDCTVDSCDAGLNDCVHAPNDGFCDDTLSCNGSESCDPDAPSPGDGCVDGTPFPCIDDGIACTVESCDEQGPTCLHTADNGLCNPGQFCVPALGGCVDSTPCVSDGECDDDNDCNGVETCDIVCQVGTPVNCNDGIACTQDSCDPNGGICSNTPNHAVCGDGLVCNGEETCVAGQGCLAGTPIPCGDGVGCTFDACQEPNGTCSHTPSNFLCNDNVFCNGVESCDPVNDCQPGTPPACADAVACTVDTCEIMTDQCLHSPDHDLCACGETCDAQDGCGSYATLLTCQGKTYECGNTLDDDADCGIDVGGDTMCLGPCDNNEDGFHLDIPGGNAAPCKQDCYFDGDTGAGNDGCYWSHKCDPLEPEGDKCTYDPNAGIPGTNLTCADAQASQSQLCLDFCGPLTPNGCDCFGCCDIPGVNYPVFLGSEDANGDPSCTLDVLTDPALCRPCTQVDSCLNTCEECELCIGKDTLPAHCLCQECPPNAQLCGDPCGTPCAFGYFCNNGCCVLTP